MSLPLFILMLVAGGLVIGTVAGLFLAQERTHGLLVAIALCTCLAALVGVVMREWLDFGDPLAAGIAFVTTPSLLYGRGGGDGGGWGWGDGGDGGGCGE